MRIQKRRGSENAEKEGGRRTAKVIIERRESSAGRHVRKAEHGRKKVGKEREKREAGEKRNRGKKREVLGV